MHFTIWAMVMPLVARGKMHLGSTLTCNIPCYHIDLFKMYTLVVTAIIYFSIKVYDIQEMTHLFSNKTFLI